MATYAAALAYRGLFGLFPFLLILVVLVGALGIPDFFDRAMDQARAQSSRYVPQQLEPVVEPAREQVQPLIGMIERAEKQAGGKLLFFGVAVALWSVSAVARTLTEAFNVAYQVAETRRWWKQLVLSLAFGPILALVVIVSVALMLIGPQLVGSIAELVGLDELFVRLWGWLRFPVALSPARRGAFRGLPFRSQRQAALSVSGPWRGACRGAVGDLLGGFYLLPGQLRQLRRHLREHWCRRRFALLSLPLRFCGVAGC